MSELKLELTAQNKRVAALELIKLKAASRTKRRIADFIENKRLKDLEDKMSVDAVQEAEIVSKPAPKVELPKEVETPKQTKK